ncbi:hypothetical protein BWI15_30770 [Kribbella sp. ALI-6-A]|uniref:DUF1700 domain-containing protein n=1 Tax=Kribbella sp. ALI-6-A TaxID=1933817 RepID=UPI00097C81AD|nr:hypothetical protein [Kribbella sp. ALI-6-A]ONI67506.1 hypothetical protein BWI15_30770 [Kribbella sp. ALI-6-A]
MNSTLTGTIATYLAQVKAELADLPPGELEDVLDDVASHLTEVAAEFEQEPTEAQLRERLGTPRQYADELRTAAGYPTSPRPPAQDRDAAERSLRWAIIAGTVGPFFMLIGLFSGSSEPAGFFLLIGAGVLFGAALLGVRALGDRSPRIVLDTPRGAQGAEFVRGLIAQIPPNVRSELVSIGQPVWWVARGMLGGGGFFALFGAGAVAVVGAIAGAGVSVWIGRRSQQDRRWLWYVVPLNVVAILAVPAALAAGFVGTSNGLFSFSNYDSRSGIPPYTTGLALDGEPIQNLYPFDEQGRQVSVRLYTENGKPLNQPLNDCNATYGQGGPTVSNLFPQAVIESHDPGVAEPDPATETSRPEQCRDTTRAPFVPPPVPATPTHPTAGTTPAPSTTPTPVPSVTPSATPSSKPTTPGVTLTVTPTR